MLFPRPEAELVAALEANIARVIRGKPAAIRHAVIALLARGHLLIEDVPGVGKTTLARALAASIGVTFHRIQFTSDLLPSDIVGVSVLDPKSGQFEFRKGAIFANLVLADEINRTTPRTQSALLEAMNDGQVSVDGHTYPLEAPFLVIATQNPEEHYGTYPLPESQMDRFLLRIRMDYPSAEDEKRLLLSRRGAPATRSRGSAPSCTAPRCARCRTPPTACTSRPSSPSTSWPSRARRASRRTSRSACRRAVSCRGATPRAPRPSPTGVTTCCPTISRGSRSPCSPTASWAPRPPRPWAGRARTSSACSRTSSSACPRRADGAT